MQIKDLKGKRFGRLLAVKIIGKTAGGGMLWECICDCGVRVNKQSGRLVSGVTKSCGCYRSELSTANGKIQGGHNRKPYGESSFNSLFKSYRESAIRRGYSFNLKPDQFRKLTKGNCSYCGIEPRQEKYNTRTGATNGEYVYNGIDRVNNLKGYTFRNCVTCCSMCNKAKDVRTVSDFYKWVCRVKQHLELKWDSSV